MLTYEEALTRIMDAVHILPPAEISLTDALGMVLAEDVVTPHDLPPFANSSMDGFAVRAADIQGASSEHPITMLIQGESAAGKPFSETLMPGQAIRIMTGAMLPTGADTVVPVEDTQIIENGVAILDAVREGQFIREAGEDVTAGTVVVSADTILRPAEMGTLAAAGRASVSVYPRPQVAIVSTGDELVEPGEALSLGQIYNSNAYALAAQVQEAGGVVTQRIHARDTPEALRRAFDACAGADVLLTSGGVSVGDYDYVQSVFAERGTVDFWRVAIRPGKPLVFGRWEQTIFFGLPGNPVSSMVTFELFVRPALRKMRGLSEVRRPVVQAKLMQEASHEPGRQSFQRAVVTRDRDGYAVQPLTRQGSGMLQSMTLANSLLILPADVGTIPAGAYASVLLLETPAFL